MARKKDILFRPWKELKDLQDRKLRYFISRHLYPFSPYYRRVFDKNKIRPGDIKTVEDLKSLPFTSKENFITLLKKDPLRGNLAFFLQPNENRIRKFLPKSGVVKLLFLRLLKGQDALRVRLEEEYRPVFLTATTGTTFLPISFLYSNYDIENLKIYGKRLIETFDMKKNQRAVNIFPYAPHLAFWQTAFAGFSAKIFILSTGGGKTLGTEGNIRAILKVKPQFLIGVPSYVYHILKTVREQDHNLSFLNRIILGAARVPQGFKVKIANLLGEMGASEVKVFGTYGFTEARCAWGECPTEIGVSSGYHTYPDREVFEVVDPETGEVKQDGEDGELVYTNIDARGSCVLRYRTGDLVKGGIVYFPCPYCGRTVPRISSDIVRASNIKNLQFSKIKGTLVNLNTFEHLLDGEEGIDGWQIEIAKRNNDPYEVDELILHLSLLDEVDKEEFAAYLNGKVSSHTEVSFNRINFVSRVQMQKMIGIESEVKAKKIVDNRPQIK